MSTEGNEESTRRGPACYDNFRAAARREPVRGVVEVTLYSDARFVGEVRSGAGPIALLNPIRMTAGQVGPAIILRCAVHSHFGPALDFGVKSDISRFTGASPWDELACLISLQHGARLVAGDITREFDGRDPLGTPRVDLDPPNITFTSPASAPTLPWVSEQKELRAGLLPLVGTLRPDQALALVRSARSYRDALWIADADPQLAWLLFVSALEVVAAHVAVPDEDDAETRLRSAAPAIAEALDSASPDAVSKVAPLLAPLVKSTARFLDFFRLFPPVPPDRRPPEGLQFRPWDTGMRKALSVIYDWRSKALHAGIPFPPLMCQPPFHGGGEAPCETVPGLGAHAQGGSWTRAEMPFGLHLFEHIVRTTIIRWWNSVSINPDAS